MKMEEYDYGQGIEFGEIGTDHDVDDVDWSHLTLHYHITQRKLGP